MKQHDDGSDEVKIISVLRTPDQAAQYLNLSTSTLAKMRCKGTGPEFCRLGGAIKYHHDSLDKYIHQRTFRSTTEADREDVREAKATSGGEK